MRRTLFLLFFVHLLTRLIFINVTGVFNNYSHQCDSYWLVKFADIASNGNFNFDIGRFIASPLFPSVCAAVKIFSAEYWAFYMILFQVLIFPMTMWYVHTFSQEMLFQGMLIISIYYLLLSLKSVRLIDTVKAAIFFSLAYLTKSHILLFTLFIPLIYFHAFRFKKPTFRLTAIFAIVVFAFSIPYGLYQYERNGTYVLSSNGAGYQFYLGNTEAGYKTIVDVPEKKTEEFLKLKDITKNAGYFNGSKEKYTNLLLENQKTKQHEFYLEAFHWIKNHPIKFIKLKIYDAIFFFIPGVSFRHYNLSDWLLSFIISLPIYFYAYKSIFKQTTSNFKEHSWIFYLTFSMLIFSTFWYVQNRFRTITLEPFYIIYASFYLNKYLNKFSPIKKLISFINFMFLEFLQSIRIKKELKTFFKLQ